MSLHTTIAACYRRCLQAIYCITCAVALANDVAGKGYQLWQIGDGVYFLSDTTYSTGMKAKANPVRFA